MIIELQNFGPIKSFKFDTSKDMHAIFGKNNIGKSYAISAVYLILKGFREYDINLSASLPLDVIETFSNKLIEKLNKEESNEYVFNEEATHFLKESLNQSVLKVLRDSFKNTFDMNNIRNVKSSEKIQFRIQLNNHSFSIVLDDINQDFVINSFYLNHPFKIQISDIEKGPIISNGEYIYYKSSDSNSINGIGRVAYNYHHELKFNANLYSIFYLPASRSGLYNALNSFGAIFAELSKNRNFIRNKIEIPNISEPISDYFLNLNTIDKAQPNKRYLKHFEEIEKEILKGKITLDDETKKYYYVPTDTDMRLELSFTSSMISEIAPIIAHLKYIIPLESDKPSILFIEEPEAHLHPEIQILLLEYFVKLSKGSVKIVMTSHSNYIFNKLSNLLIANKIDKEKLSVSLMKMTPEGSVIEDGAMQMDEYGIEDNNFVDVAEQLYEERMSLLEKL